MREKSSAGFVPHGKVGKGQVHQPHEVHHGEDDSTGGRVLPGELVQQQAGGADDDEDEGGYFKEVFHLNVDYNMIRLLVKRYPTPDPSFLIYSHPGHPRPILGLSLSLAIPPPPHMSLRGASDEAISIYRTPALPL